MKKQKWVLVLCVSLVFGSLTIFAQPTKTSDPFDSFWTQFLSAVRSGDTARIANFTAFPLEYHWWQTGYPVGDSRAGGTKNIKQKEFIAQFEDLFPLPAREAFSENNVPAFCSAGGNRLPSPSYQEDRRCVDFSVEEESSGGHWEFALVKGKYKLVAYFK